MFARWLVWLIWMRLAKMVLSGVLLDRLMMMTFIYRVCLKDLILRDK